MKFWTGYLIGRLIAEDRRSSVCSCCAVSEDEVLKWPLFLQLCRKKDELEDSVCCLLVLGFFAVALLWSVIFCDMDTGFRVFFSMLLIADVVICAIGIVKTWHQFQLVKRLSKQTREESNEN